jgi:ketosteroid isomerase-like protein
MSESSIHPSSVDRFIDRLHPAFLAGDDRATEKACEAGNVQRLLDQYRAIARGDLQAAVAMMADDIEFDLAAPADVPISGAWRGVAAVADAVRRNFGSLADQQADLVSVVAQGDMVVLVAEERGTVRSTGQPYHLRWVQVFTFRGDKIIRLQGVAAHLTVGG